MPDYKDYLKNQPSPGIGDVVSDQMKGLPIPPIQKETPGDANLIDLIPHQELKIKEIPLLEAVQNRRTRRLFSESAITLEELSFLLWITQGVQHLVRSGLITLRTVPSAGGMHPFETYLFVNRVENLPQGIYRYIALEHKLLKTKEMVGLSDMLVKACNDQDFVSKGAVVFIWSARPYRSEWRNGQNALKDILITAGHICQNLYLGCEAINAGLSPIMTYEQKILDELIDADGEEELAVYLAVVGKVDTSVIQL